MVVDSNRCGFQTAFCDRFDYWGFFRVCGGGAVSVLLYALSTCCCTRGFKSRLGYLSKRMGVYGHL